MDITKIDLIVLFIVCLCLGALWGIPLGERVYKYTLEKEKDAAIDLLNDCYDLISSNRATIPAWQTLNLTINRTNENEK